MKKFQKTAPSSENDNSNNSSYETADIRLRNQSQKIQQPIFAVGRLQSNQKNRIEFVKSEFEDKDVGPCRFSWHTSNSNIPAMDAIRTKIKLLEYKIIHNFNIPSFIGDSQGKNTKILFDLFLQLHNEVFPTLYIFQFFILGTKTARQTHGLYIA